ncbi:hypothetical protein HMPREF0372_03999 [Flavonifractor plautii ATCC 29863]|uniref:Uncharacterized protein n=1 Tax=Flavonifractor plautii ATCC 29863 TaxID=411475 RepID=G9YWT1_FLAPL|nr:hypothetical protein HMPREF0372_03999 [Flavonifractor plautii ATCC 29863]
MKPADRSCFSKSKKDAVHPTARADCFWQISAGNCHHSQHRER